MNKKEKENEEKVISFSQNVKMSVWVLHDNVGMKQKYTTHEMAGKYLFLFPHYCNHHYQNYYWFNIHTKYVVVVVVPHPKNQLKLVHSFS